ncbi:MAG: hypothetical protein R3B05_17930 [Nitrospira sp.]
MWDITKAKHHEEKLRQQQVRLKDLTLRLLHAQDNGMPSILTRVA